MFNEKEEQLLIDLVNTIKTDVVNSLQEHGRVASGDTINALEVVTVGNSVQLTAPGFITALEYGRRPTSPDAPAGDPTLLDRIKEWCQDKGIDQKLAYPITQNIHKYGYKGTPGVLTNPLSDDNVNKRADEVADKLASILITSIFDFDNFKK